MIGLIAFVPQPPLLVPELVSGAAAPTRALRTACVTAARELAAAAGQWVAIGADAAGPLRVPATAAGSFAGFGADVRVSLGPHPGPGGGGTSGELPLPLLIAGWLRAAAGQHAKQTQALSVTGLVVHPDTGPTECLAHGRALAAELAETPAPTGLLVVGDGAARHPYAGAGRVDQRAGPFDDTVRAALAEADVDPLADIDADLAAELGVTGRPSWQTLAGVVRGLGLRWRGTMLYSAAPYGVGYHVAVWRRADQ